MLPADRRLISVIFLFAGIIAIIYSLLAGIANIAYVGLGILFWGIIIGLTLEKETKAKNKIELQDAINYQNKTFEKRRNDDLIVKTKKDSISNERPSTGINQQINTIIPSMTNVIERKKTIDNINQKEFPIEKNPLNLSKPKINNDVSKSANSNDELKKIDNLKPLNTLNKKIDSPAIEFVEGIKNCPLRVHDKQDCSFCNAKDCSDRLEKRRN
jgi:hypothetical protein